MMDSDRVKGSAFWDRIAVRYSNKPVPDESVYQQKLEIVRKHLHPAAQVLELGCGTGSTAIALSGDAGQICARDFSTAMIDIARDKAAAAGVSNVQFEVADIGSEPAEEGTMDVVLAMSVLHLLPDRDAVIRHAYRCLKPGGIFISSTACLSGKYRLLKPVIAMGSLMGFVPTVYFFGAKELCANLQRAGFDIQQEWQPGGGPSLFLVAKKT